MLQVSPSGPKCPGLRPTGLHVLLLWFTPPAGPPPQAQGSKRLFLLHEGTHGEGASQGRSLVLA